MRVMQSMEYDDEDKLDAVLPMPATKPDFPYNLRISLTERELKKLDLDPKDAEVGGMIHGFFMGRVTSVRIDPDEKCCVEIQIEDLGIESEDEENEED